jgi:hypothetical protein
VGAAGKIDEAVAAGSFVPSAPFEIAGFACGGD